MMYDPYYGCCDCTRTAPDEWTWFGSHEIHVKEHSKRTNCNGQRLKKNSLIKSLSRVPVCNEEILKIILLQADLLKAAGSDALKVPFTDPNPIFKGEYDEYDNIDGYSVNEILEHLRLPENSSDEAEVPTEVIIKNFEKFYANKCGVENRGNMSIDSWKRSQIKLIEKLGGNSGNISLDSWKRSQMKLIEKLGGNSGNISLDSWKRSQMELIEKLGESGENGLVDSWKRSQMRLIEKLGENDENGLVDSWKRNQMNLIEKLGENGENGLIDSWKRNQMKLIEKLGENGENGLVDSWKRNKMKLIEKLGENGESGLVDSRKRNQMKLIEKLGENGENGLVDSWKRNQMKLIEKLGENGENGLIDSWKRSRMKLIEKLGENGENGLVDSWKRNQMKLIEKLGESGENGLVDSRKRNQLKLIEKPELDKHRWPYLPTEHIKQAHDGLTQMGHKAKTDTQFYDGNMRKTPNDIPNSVSEQDFAEMGKTERLNLLLEAIEAHKEARLKFFQAVLFLQPFDRRKRWTYVPYDLLDLNLDLVKAVTDLHGKPFCNWSMKIIEPIIQKKLAPREMLTDEDVLQIENELKRALKKQMEHENQHKARMSRTLRGQGEKHIHRLSKPITKPNITNIHLKFMR